MMSGFKTVNIQREIQDTVRRVPPLLIHLFDLSLLSDSSAFDTHARREDSSVKSHQAVVYSLDILNILTPCVFPLQTRFHLVG